jgi:hypothetical protein
VRLALRSFAEHSALAQAGIDEKTELERNEPIDDIYTRIEKELLNQYNLGFVPDNSAGGGFRLSLEAEVQNPIFSAEVEFFT